MCTIEFNSRKTDTESMDTLCCATLYDTVCVCVCVSGKRNEAEAEAHRETPPNHHCTADKACKRNHIYQQACHVVEFSALKFIFGWVCVCAFELFLFNVKSSNVSMGSKEEGGEREGKNRKTHKYS